MLSTHVNVDVKMSKKMLRALSLFETFCVVQNKHTTTEDEIRGFLTERFGADLSSKFQTDYVFKAQGASTNLQ
jgi:hypothetical protein